jgi:hypothetical protein
MRMMESELTLVHYGNTQGTTWTIPSPSQYNSRHFFCKSGTNYFIALWSCHRKKLLVFSGECTVGSQQDLSQMTRRTVRTMVLRYAMARLGIETTNPTKNLFFFLGSDVKQEIE